MRPTAVYGLTIRQTPPNKLNRGAAPSGSAQLPGGIDRVMTCMMPDQVAAVLNGKQRR